MRDLRAGLERATCALALTALGLLLGACGFPPGPPPDVDATVDTRVRATVQALAASSPSALPSPSPSPTRVLAEALAFSGSGSMRTRPFALDGTHEIAWLAQVAPDGAGCAHSQTLVPVNPRTHSAVPLGQGSARPGQPFEGKQLLARVPLDQYYVEVVSGCVWSLTVSPSRVD